VLVVYATAVGPARALEGDQFYAWGRELADATDVLNAKVRLEIARALEEVNSNRSWRDTGCRQVVKQITPRFNRLIFTDIEMWAANSSLVARIPATTDEELEYRKALLYRNTHAFDVGTKVPPSATIEMNGVRLGTDKLAHFFSEGWYYLRWYEKFRKKGLPEEQAEQRVIRRGIWWERTILGLISSGVFSTADLEANYQGMRFLIGLCDGESPTLQQGASGWEYVGAFDFRDYVSPEWDETYQTPIFRKHRWKKVRPALIEYCPKLEYPSVIRQREEYARRDRVTPTEREVQRLVNAGKLRDPGQFALESNCAPSTGVEATVSAATD